MWFIEVVDDRVTDNEMRKVAFATGTVWESESSKLTGDYMYVLQAFGTLAMMQVRTNRLKVQFDEICAESPQDDGVSNQDS